MSDNATPMNALSELELCKITPCSDVSTSEKQNALKLTQAQAAKINAFVSHIPEITSTVALANAYTVTFPKGVNGALMQYKNGSFGTPIIGENGRIVDHASLNPVSPELAMVSGVFSILAIASSQYYLTELHNELKKLNNKIDTILNFLYGDKKAELLSEICFVQNTYNNFSSIMQHNEQRVATIMSLQSAQKIAMKDIEFYLSDLKDKVNKSAKNYTDFAKLTEEAFKLKDSLETSMQLYALANVMEVFYSQNYDNDYIASLKENIVYYINKCDKQVLSDFSKLSSANTSFKGNKINKIDTAPIGQKLEKVVESLNDGNEVKLSKVVSSTLDSIFDACTFRIDKTGAVYKIA